MLTLRLQQIKELLEEKNQTSVLSMEEFDLLEELNFLNEKIQNENEIQSLRRISRPPKREGTILEMIAPAPDKCPACGRRF